MIIKLEVFDIGLLPGPPENPRVLLPYDRSRVVASPYEFRDFQKTYFATMGASVGVWVVDTQAYGPVSTSEHVSRHDDGNLRILGIPVVVREVPEIFRGYTYAELLQHASPTVRLWAVANLGALVAPRRQPATADRARAPPAPRTMCRAPLP